MEAVEKFEVLKGIDKAVAANRADFITGRCWKMVELAKKAFDNDTMTRDLVSATRLGFLPLIYDCFRLP